MADPNDPNPFASPQSEEVFEQPEAFAPYAEGALLVTPPQCELPPRCVRCNRPAPAVRTLRTMWITAGGVTNVSVHFHVCPRHNRRQLLNKAFSLLLFVLIGLGFVGVTVPTVLLVLCVSVWTLANVMIPGLRVKRADGSRVSIVGAGLPFLYSLEDEDESGEA